MKLATEKRPYIPVLILAGLVLRVLGGMSTQIRRDMIVLGILSLVIGGRGGARRDKAIIFITMAMGLGPMLGWIYGLGNLVDPLLCLAVVSVLLTVDDIIQNTVKFHWELTPVMVLAGFTWRYWLPWSNLGGTVARLARLLWGWDHFGHFYLFMVGVRYDGFLARIKPPSIGGVWYDKNYPGGIQLAWAQWWRLNKHDAILHPLRYVPQYAHSVIVNMVLVAVLMVLAVVRVVRTPRIRILAGTLVSGFVLGFLVLGHLAVIVWEGFPNFGAAIAGGAVALSFAYKPLTNKWINTVVMISGFAVCAYNWYPVAVPVAAIAAWLLIDYIRTSQGRDRWLMVALLGVSGILLALPVLQTFEFGVSHLETPGGIIAPPANYMLFMLMLSFGVALWMLGENFSWALVRKLSPLLIAPAFQMLVMAALRISTGKYPYYAQKMSYFTVAFSILTLFLLGADWANERKWPEVKFLGRGFGKYLYQFGVVAFLALGIAQQTGYVGIDSTLFAGSSMAYGKFARNGVITKGPYYERTARTLINLEKAADGAPLKDLTCLVFLDTMNHTYSPVLMSYWSAVVTWSVTDARISRAESLPFLWHAYPKMTTAQRFNKELDPSKDCPVTSKYIANKMEKLNPAWKGRIWRIDEDGVVTPPKRHN
jgi:hypothetical protein